MLLIRDFLERFKDLNNKKANIQINHLLYGKQKISRCVLHPFADEERIGLIIEDEKRYINMDELLDVYIDDAQCYIKSEVMELYIVL